MNKSVYFSSIFLKNTMILAYLKGKYLQIKNVSIPHNGNMFVVNKSDSRYTL